MTQGRGISHLLLLVLASKSDLQTTGAKAESNQKHKDTPESHHGPRRNSGKYQKQCKVNHGVTVISNKLGVFGCILFWQPA